MTKKNIFTPEEISKGLQVADRTIYGWIKRGKLKAFKAGHLWRIKRTDLESFLNMPIPWEEE
jgi:PTS system nitrogen regulatory IIA component